MNMYITITFFVTAAFYSAILFIPTHRFSFFDKKASLPDPTRNCTPFYSNYTMTPVEEVGLFPKDGTLINRVVFSLLVQFSIYLILYMIGYNSKSHIAVLNNVKDLKFKEYELKIRELQEKLGKLDLKEKLMR